MRRRYLGLVIVVLGFVAILVPARSVPYNNLKTIIQTEDTVAIVVECDGSRIDRRIEHRYLAVRAREVVRWAVANGTLHIRAHADVSGENEAMVRGLLRVRDELARYLQP